ncbi:MAG: hypothetical protein U1F43_17565 [Myxococcota bacterium]
MLAIHRAALALSLAALTTGGCVRQVFSPPAGYLSLDGPDRLEEGKSTLGGSLGVGGIGIGADIAGGNVLYKRGLGAVELDAEGAVVAITEKSKADTFPAILSTRVGLKGRIVPGFRHLAWRAGLGFGGSAGGTFGASDLGLVLGWENPYATPFVGLSGMVSLPFSSRTVDISNPDDETPVTDHPVTSGGVALTLGLAVHIGPSDAMLNLGVSRLQLWDIHGVEEEVTSAALGFAIPL